MTKSCCKNCFVEYHKDSFHGNCLDKMCSCHSEQVKPKECEHEWKKDRIGIDPLNLGGPEHCVKCGICEHFIPDPNKLCEGPCNCPAQAFVERWGKEAEGLLDTLEGDAYVDKDTDISREKIKFFIRSILQAQKEETIKEFISGRRCHDCGEPKEQNPLVDICAKCLEEN